MENNRRSIQIKSFAKINVGLEIVRKRDDGFHDLKTIFQTVSLHDTLEFSENESGNIKISGDLKSVPWDRRNVIYKIADVVYRNFDIKKGINIRVKKKYLPDRDLVEEAVMPQQH